MGKYSPYEISTSPNMVFAFFTSSSAIPAVDLTKLKENGRRTYISFQSVFEALARETDVIYEVRWMEENTDLGKSILTDIES